MQGFCLLCRTQEVTIAQTRVAEMAQVKWQHLQWNVEILYNSSLLLFSQWPAASQSTQWGSRAPNSAGLLHQTHAVRGHVPQENSVNFSIQYAKYTASKEERATCKQWRTSWRYSLPPQAVSVLFQGTWATAFHFWGMHKCSKPPPCQLWEGIQLFPKPQSWEAQLYPSEGPCRFWWSSYTSSDTEGWCEAFLQEELTVKLEFRTTYMEIH